MDEPEAAKAAKLVAEARRIAEAEGRAELIDSGRLMGQLSAVYIRLARALVLPELTRGDPLESETIEDANRALREVSDAIAFLASLIGPEGDE